MRFWRAGRDEARGGTTGICSAARSPGSRRATGGRRPPSQDYRYAPFLPPTRKESMRTLPTQADLLNVIASQRALPAASGTEVVRLLASLLHEVHETPVRQPPNGHVRDGQDQARTVCGGITRATTTGPIAAVAAVSSGQGAAAALITGQVPWRFADPRGPDRRNKGPAEGVLPDLQPQSPL